MNESAIAVGCIYDGSGMATWCLEAAHALAEAGERVCLLHSTGVPTPRVSDGIRLVPVDARDTRAQLATGRLRREFSRTFVGPRPCLQAACTEMARQGLAPAAFLLNATFFLDARVAVPQGVVAWCYPSSFFAYMRKMPMHHPRLCSIDGVRTLLDQIGFYRNDWHGYRHASLVMSVSRRLDAELRARGVRSVTVHPGTRIGAAPRRSTRGVKRLVIMAVSLDAPRKRVAWMLEALRDFPVAAEITLIGECSPELRRLAEATGLPVTLTGRLPRDEALAAMQDGDVFLFGSMLDDWGYVLLESMSHGLTVVAPRMSPFDEIVGEMGHLFSLHSPQSFREQAIVACTQDGIDGAARAQWLEERFSRKAFGAALQGCLARIRGGAGGP